ncbi:40S ribosomal protein S12 [Dirofilaria immitis]|nr:40S ribosomal protein S12 [Dirofilaria immitis]
MLGMAGCGMRNAVRLFTLSDKAVNAKSFTGNDFAVEIDNLLEKLNADEERRDCMTGVVGENPVFSWEESLGMAKSDESLVTAEVSSGTTEYNNDPLFEIAWAIKAVERANIHMSLLLTCNTKELMMHKKFNVIYDKFRQIFPKMNVEKVTEIELKGENKQQWFTFCEHFKEEIEDYNLATIMRIRVDGVYSEANTIIVPKGSNAEFYFRYTGTTASATSTTGSLFERSRSHCLALQQLQRKTQVYVLCFYIFDLLFRILLARFFPSVGLFVTPTSLAASTIPTGGFVGTTGGATTSTFCGPVGSTSVTATPGLFSATPTATVAGSLLESQQQHFITCYNRFCQWTFGINGTPTTAAGVGLGGTGTLMTTGLISNSLGVAGAVASGNPLEAEVQQVVMDLFNLLREQIKKNHELSVEFAMNSSESCLHMDEKIEELVGTRVKNADITHKIKGKANARPTGRRADTSTAERNFKNPHFGRKQAFSYLLSVCIEHENTAREFWETLQLLHERIGAKLNKKDIITKQDLQKHFEHYDQTFKVICSDVYRCKIQIEDLKDAFLEYQKRNVPYALNPFQRRKSKHVEKSSAEKRFTGADAFPSQITMMKIGEMAKFSSATQQTAGVSGFGTTGSLFGSKTSGNPAFSFNPSVTNTTVPLFKPFSATNSAPVSLFGSLATSAAEPTSIPTTTSSLLLEIH